MMELTKAWAMAYCADLWYDLTMFKNTMDISNPIMAGHSYGGATTLMALSKDSR